MDDISNGKHKTFYMDGKSQQI